MDCLRLEGAAPDSKRSMRNRARVLSVGSSPPCQSVIASSAILYARRVLGARASRPILAVSACSASSVPVTRAWIAVLVGIGIA